MANHLTRQRAGSRAVRRTLGTAVFLLLVTAPLLRGWSDESTPATSEANLEQSAPPEVTIDPLSVNANCCVCHIPFVREEISRVHFAEGVTCIKCHGLSAAHANDENVGATKPDIRFARGQIDKMCVECHEKHDVPARAVLARFLERKLTDTAAVCTDCHGQHQIEIPAEDESGQ